MTFLHPTLALIGVACIAIPIIIHFLMRRRRKPIQWAAMRFLLEAYRKHRKRLRLEQLLLLASRCLLIALIALALGRPLLSAAGLLQGTGATTVYILLDNSLAASAVDDAGVSALDRHKRLADAILARLDAGEGDRAGLVLLGSPAEAIVVPPSSDVSSVRALAADAAATDSRADLPAAAAMLQGLMAGDAEAGRRMIVILSDFLEGSAATDAALSRLADDASTTIIATPPAAEGLTNVTITGVEPLRAVMLAEVGASPELARQEQVTVLLRRTGPGVSSRAITTIRVRFVGDDGTTGVAQHALTWDPGQTTARASLMPGGVITPGRAVIIAEIDRDAIAGDNLFRRSIEVRQRLRIGLIAPRQVGGAAGLDPYTNADWIRLALQPGVTDRREWVSPVGEDLEVVGIEPGAVDAARLAGLDAAIVAAPDAVTPDGWRRLAHLADAGGLVIVLPRAREGAQVWTDFFTSAFNLDWTIARETSQTSEGVAVAAPARAADASALLAVVSPELEELVKPVRVYRSIPIHASTQAEIILTLEDGSPWIVAGAPGADDAGDRRGLVVLFGSSLSAEWTDLAGRPLFVPLVHELLRQGIGRAHGSFMSVAGARPVTPQRAVELRSVEGVWGITREADSAAIPVDADGRASSPARRAGLWRAIDARGGDRGLVAVNADPAAARSDAVSPSDVAAWLSGLGDVVRQLVPEGADLSPALGEALTPATLLHDPRKDSPLSLPLLQAAIFIALIEMFLARRFSHADAKQGANTLPAKAAAA